MYLCSVDINYIEVHGDQGAKKEEQHREPKPEDRKSEDF